MSKKFRLACSLTSYPNGTERPEMPEWLKDTERLSGARPIAHTYWLKIYWATPPWITEEMIDEMRELYLSAKEGEHVDHIVPLRSPIVCGLHVPWNLEKISEKQNYAKSNHMWLGHPCEHNDLFGDYEPQQLRLFLW